MSVVNCYQSVFHVDVLAVLSPLLFAVYIDDIGKSCDPRNGCLVILYADDIILITTSVTLLQNLLFARENLIRN